jgi:hypothetical protein
LLASTISAPLTAFANEDAARFVLGLSSNCPLCNNFSPFLFSTTKRNFSPLLRISIFPAINVLLVVIGIRVYAARRQDVPARRAVSLSLAQYHFGSRQGLLITVLVHENELLLEPQTSALRTTGPARGQVPRRLWVPGRDVSSGYVRVLWELWADGLTDDKRAAGAAGPS